MCDENNQLPGSVLPLMNNTGGSGQVAGSPGPRHCANCGSWYTGYHDCMGMTLGPNAGPAVWPQAVPVWSQPERRPHTCPVCVGKGKVAGATTTGNTGGEVCPACKGACVLWG